MVTAVDHGHGLKPFARPPRFNLSSQLDYKMLDFTRTKLAQSLQHAFAFNTIHRSISTPCLSRSSQSKDHASNNFPNIEIIVGHAAPRVRALVAEVAIAIASGSVPEPVPSGLGGAYFLRSQNGDIIAVAKPIDEEPLAINNPKGLAGRMLGQPGLKCSIRIGETGLRESAAYFLDHQGFAGVPPTALVRFSQLKFNHTETDMSQGYKIASLQRFVSHDTDAGDLGPSSFSVASVHYIGILDVRLMNLDRHAGNILVRQGRDSNYAGGTAELVPIDHGFCLPESLDDPYFEWLHWPQASIPFSEAEMDYVSRLNPYKDADILRSELPSIAESSVRVLVLCTIFLKQAASYGLCLSDIGEMMTREFCRGKETWSSLENLCMNVKDSLDKGLLSSDGICESIKVQEGGVDEMFEMDDLDGGKPMKFPRFLSLSVLDDDSELCCLNENVWCPIDDADVFTTKEDDDFDNDDDNDSDDSGNNPKGSGLMRSLSYSVPTHNLDGQCICFGEMDESEWEMFLEGFEKALPMAFEERKSMGLSKQRLGSSCEF